MQSEQSQQSLLNYITFLHVLLVPISSPLSFHASHHRRQHLLINHDPPYLPVSSNTAKQSSSYTPISLEQPLYITTRSLIITHISPLLHHLINGCPHRLSNPMDSRLHYSFAQLDGSL